MKKAINGLPTHMAKSILIGLCVGLLVMGTGCALTAIFVHNRWLPEEAIRYCAWAVCAVSAFAGSMTAQRRSGKANLPVSLGLALLLLLSMFLLRLAAADGEIRSWYGAIIVGVAAVAAAFIRAGRGNRHR